MIQNPIILKKLKEKTCDDEILRDFLLSILKNEAEGKQYNKYYKKEIDKSIKKIELKGGKIE